jgi:hypothetical protein
VILLNGILREVPLSALAALRRLRLPDQDRTVWIDAVCINQDDSAEKGYQVAVMHQIYTKTKHNVIYLGGSDHDTAWQLDAVYHVLRNAQESTDDFRTFVNTVKATDGYLTVATTSIAFGPSIKEATRFFARPWFRRLWVRIVLPQTSLRMLLKV